VLKDHIPSAVVCKNIFVQLHFYVCVIISGDLPTELNITKNESLLFVTPIPMNSIYYAYNNAALKRIASSFPIILSANTSELTFFYCLESNDGASYNIGILHNAISFRYWISIFEYIHVF